MGRRADAPSLTRYLLEEAYEVVEAIEPLDVPTAPRALQDELGDLLYQVVFHATLAEETGEFTLADVARGVHDKLVRRHPHVFGDVVAEETADVMRNWEQIKKDEKGTTSVIDGLTPGLPSLLYTHKMFRKAGAAGLEPGSLDDALDRIDAALAASANPHRRPRRRPVRGATGAGARRVGRRGPRRWHRRRVRPARLGVRLPPPLRGRRARGRRHRRRAHHPLARPPDPVATHLLEHLGIDVRMWG